jgi:putative PIN family toxin of toxin-antitoxin system
VNALLDTNVWVSALINPHGVPAQLRRAWEEERFRTVTSEYALRELTAVLARPRIRALANVDQPAIDRLVHRLQEVSILVVTTGGRHICRDPKDDLILETAVAGRAKYLVTRDDDIKRDEVLMSELKASGVMVISVAGFLEVLASSG